MPAPGLLDSPELSLEAIDARSSRENFPVASLLAPPEARPHLRAVYGFARLVDTLGDEAAGDRERPARRARARARRARPHADDATPARDDRGLRPPARAVRAPDRGQPDRPADEPLRDLARASGVLHLLGRAGGPARARHLRPGRRPRARRSKRRRLHGPPARELRPGPAPRPRARTRLPAAGGPAPLLRPRRGSRRPASERVAALLRFEAERARPLLERGFGLGRAIGGRAGRSVVLFAQGGLAALAALERAGWDVFTRRPAPSRARLARLAARELLRR